MSNNAQFRPLLLGEYKLLVGKTTGGANQTSQSGKPRGKLGRNTAFMMVWSTNVGNILRPTLSCYFCLPPFFVSSHMLHLHHDLLNQLLSIRRLVHLSQVEKHINYHILDCFIWMSNTLNSFNSLSSLLTLRSHTHSNRSNIDEFILIIILFFNWSFKKLFFSKYENLQLVSVSTLEPTDITVGWYYQLILAYYRYIGIGIKLSDMCWDENSFIYIRKMLWVIHNHLIPSEVYCLSALMSLWTIGFYFGI